MRIGGGALVWGVSGGQRRRSSRSRPGPSVDGASRDSTLGGAAVTGRGLQRSPLGCLKPVLQQLRVEALALAERAVAQAALVSADDLCQCIALQRSSLAVTTHLVNTKVLAARRKQSRLNRRARNGPTAASGAVRPSLGWIRGPLRPAVRFLRLRDGFWPASAGLAIRLPGVLGKRGRSLPINY